MNYEEYQSDVALECKSCGWKGTTKGADLSIETQEMADLDCPKCGEKIATVVVALYEGDLERMAAKGDASAKEALGEHRAIEASLLKSASGLPELKCSYYGLKLHFYLVLIPILDKN